MENQQETTMKKLMIAAAAAAMIGGAFATDGTVYTFKMSLKTTVGKAGKLTETINLGADIDGTNFWYQDASINPLYTTNTAYFTTKKVGGKYIPALTSAAKKDAAWLDANIVPLATKYSYKSANKWCESFKVTDEGCYRVTGTKKFEDIVLAEDLCCDTLTGADGIDTITPDFVQLFGSLSYENAKKVETFAQVEGDGIDTMYIAGQGSIGKIKYAYDDDLYEETGLSSISGNAVGILDAPACEYCCTADVPAVAFECGKVAANATLTTAAYGTWSLKYNAKETKDLVD